MQKFGECELCGSLNLVADYGPQGEFICVECAITHFDFATMVDEMENRIGKEAVLDIFEDVMSDKTRH